MAKKGGKLGRLRANGARGKAVADALVSRG